MKPRYILKFIDMGEPYLYYCFDSTKYTRHWCRSQLRGYFTSNVSCKPHTFSNKKIIENLVKNKICNSSSTDEEKQKFLDSKFVIENA